MKRILLCLTVLTTSHSIAQKMDGTDTLVPPPAREFQASNASELINLIYQALPLSPLKKVLLPPEVEVSFNFTPGTDQSENLTAKILEKLAEAESEILFSSGALTVQEIAAALVEKKLQGKIVVGIMSESPSGMKNYTAPSYFIVNNLPIFFDRSKLVNGNNFFIIDRQAVIIVSTNMSRTQLNESSSNVLYIKDPGVAVAYYNAWIEQLRTSSVPKITQSILNKIASKTRANQAPAPSASPAGPSSDPWAPPVPTAQDNPANNQ
jgi:hypothetical protein